MHLFRISIFIFFAMVIHSFQMAFAQKLKEIDKSLRISNYSTYISDNSINAKGFSNMVEMYNYHFSNNTSLSLLSFGGLNKYSSAQNSFNYFSDNLRFKNVLSFVKGNTMANEIRKLYWDPMKKTWTTENIPGKFPPKDTLINKEITDIFTVAGLGLQSYKKNLNLGIEGYFINKAGDRPDKNAQLSLIADLFHQRNLSAFFHSDLIFNPRYKRMNKDNLYFLEGAITGKIYPFTIIGNAGYGKSIFRYAILDNGYLEYSPVFLKYTMGIKTICSVSSHLDIFFSISRNGYHPPNNNSSYTAFYGGIKVALKKY